MNLSQKNSSEPVILIVDDNLDNLKLLSDMLRKNGYKTRRAINGNLALQALKATQFDLILLDITMPAMDGYEVCHKIKTNSSFAHIPIIFISALNDVLDKVKAFKVGGIDYITKPFQIEEVTARVANQIRIVNLQKQLAKLNQELIEKNYVLQQEQHHIKQSQARLVQHSLKDPITNLNTKIAFMGQVRQIIKTALENKNSNYALITLQDEQFKLNKSILSIEAEKKSLILISKQLAENAPDSSIIGRLDETEFGILITNFTHTEDIIKIIHNLQNKLILSLSLEEKEFVFNPSYGIVLGHQSYQYPEQLLYNARNALTYAINQGYGQYQIFNQEIQQKIFNNLKLQFDFKKTLKQQNLIITYHPVMNISTGKISGFKTDIFWKNNQEQTMALSQLGEIANKINLLPEFNYLFWSNICDRSRKLQEAFMWQDGLETNFEINFQMFIKLSAEQLLQANFAEQIQNIMQASNVEGEQLILELPSRVLLEQYERIVSNLNQIKNLSINLSLDQISTESLIFIHEHKLNISHITINSGLLKNLGENEVYHYLIAIAKNLEMKVIALGVTNAQQLETLKQYECQFATGSYIKKLAQPKLQLINKIVF